MTVDWGKIEDWVSSPQLQLLMKTALNDDYKKEYKWNDSGKYYWEVLLNQINKEDDVDEIQQAPVRLSLWEEVKNYFIKERSEYTRQDLINYIEIENGIRGSTHSIDTYRNYLYKAGYLETIRRGVYRKINEIPVDLSISDVREEAYGMKKENKNEYIIRSEKFKDLMAPILQKNKRKKNEFLTEDEMML